MGNDIGIQELEYLARQYKKLPHGEERIEAIRHAVKRADELGVQEWRLENRNNLRNEIYNCGDRGELLPILSEFITIFEEQPLTEYVSNYLHAFYTSLTQWGCFPQLPLAEYRKIAEHFYEACKRYGANLTDYYDKQAIQLRKEGKIEEARAYEKKALAALRKQTPIQVAYCAACDQYQKVRYAIYDNDIALAEKLAKPLLTNRLKCDMHPTMTVRALLEMAYRSGDWEKVQYYVKRLDEVSGLDWDDHDWSLIRYYAFTDLEKGVKLFTDTLPYLYKRYDKGAQHGFYEDVCAFWMQYAKKYDTVTMELPQNFPLYREDGMYVSSEVANWFYKKTMEISKQFDTRNGYPYYENEFLDIIEGMRKMEQWHRNLF